MAVLDTIGATTITDTGYTKSWNRRDGVNFQTIYKGPIDAAEDQFENQIRGDTNAEVRLTVNNGVGTVEVVDSSADIENSSYELNDYWELIGRGIMKSVDTCTPFNVAANIGEVRIAKMVYESGGTTWTSSNTDSAIAAVANKYWAIVSRGTDQYIRTAPILRLSRRASNWCDVETSWSDVDRAITTSGISPHPPSAIIGAISSMPEYDGKKHWLKSAPQVRQIRADRWEIVYEWMFAHRWSFTLYDGDNETDNP